MSGDRIRVNRSVSIPLSDLEIRFSTSGGPGGQHANKASTRVEVVLDVAACRGLRPVQKARVIERLGSVVRVVADDHRSQPRNRELALERLADRLAGALHVPKARRATKPSRGSKERRLKAKRQRSEVKANRRRPVSD